MIIIGLTGSIGMGKSTCGQMLRDLGVPVHESDAAVHALLAQNGAGEAAVIAAFPSLSPPIDRQALGAIVFNDSAKRQQLEDILHPLVQNVQQDFIAQQRAEGAAIVALDIPLLFETGAEARVDYTIVASAPVDIQRDRVMQRPNMTEAKFTAIKSRQIPDTEKRKKADFVVDTGTTLDQTRKQIEDIISQLTKANLKKDQ